SDLDLTCTRCHEGLDESSAGARESGAGCGLVVATARLRRGPARRARRALVRAHHRAAGHDRADDHTGTVPGRPVRPEPASTRAPRRAARLVTRARAWSRGGAATY